MKIKRPTQTIKKLTLAVLLGLLVFGPATTSAQTGFYSLNDLNFRVDTVDSTSRGSDISTRSIDVVYNDTSFF